MSRAAANLLLCLTAAIWGLGFVAQSTAMAAIGPLTFNAAKFALAALVLLPFALGEARRSGAPSPAELGSFCLVGLALSCAAALQQIGIVRTSVTNAGFLTLLYVVLTPLLALLILRVRPHPVVWPAAAGCLAGVALISGGGLDRLEGGDALVIGGALFWALHILSVGVFGQRSGKPFTLSFVQFAVVALVSLPGLVLEAPRWAGLASALPEILYGGLVATGLAFTLQVIAQRHTPPSQAAIFLAAEAPFAALFGALLLGERLGAGALAGCATIFLAMLAVELVPMRRSRGSSTAPREAGSWTKAQRSRAES